MIITALLTTGLGPVDILTCKDDLDSKCIWRLPFLAENELSRISLLSLQYTDWNHSYYIAVLCSRLVLWQVILLTLGRRVTVVVLSFIRSLVLSTALQRAALTSSLQLRYEQAKRVDGLQSDGWILLKCFRSRVMAGSP